MKNQKNKEGEGFKTKAGNYLTYIPKCNSLIKQKSYFIN